MTCTGEQKLMTCTGDQKLMTCTVDQKLVTSPVDQKLVTCHGDQRLVYIDRSGYVRIYDTTGKKWNNIIKVPNWIDEYSAVCTYNNGIVVCGAGANTTISSKKICLVDLDNRNTNIASLPDLPKHIHLSSVLHTGKHIYVFGGWLYTHINTVYRLCLRKKKWEELAPLIEPVCLSLVTSHNNLIYVLGGWDHENERNCVQVYNTDTNTWKLGGYVPRTCSNHNAGVVIYKGKLTVAADGKCMSYDDMLNRWDVVAIKSLGDHLKPVIYQNQLHACVHKGETLVLFMLGNKMKKWTPAIQYIPNAWTKRYLFTV